MKTNKINLSWLVTVVTLSLPSICWGLQDGHELELVSRTMYWNDSGVKSHTTARVSYEQSAFGLQAIYRSPFWSGVIGIDGTLLGVVKIADSGTPSTSILELGNNGQVVNAYSTMSQALVKLKLGDLGLLKLGRQTQEGLMLNSSTTRAAPDTFSGANLVLNPSKELKIYGSLYDRWRARSNPDFEEFKTYSTVAGAPKVIKYVAIGGVKYAKGPYEVQAEYLNSKDYLAKYGVVVSYLVPIEGKTLKLTGGVFASRDAGSLFVCGGAEREVDCTGTGRIDNSATGSYIDANWIDGALSIGGAVSHFNGLWIEDNFAADAEKKATLNPDHGTNPFPTSSILGPDFTNNGETAWAVRLAYDWNQFVPGLKASLKYVKGAGAKSSNLVNAAVGNESYKELNIKYSIPTIKNLVFSYSYGDYYSHVDNYLLTADIKGMGRESWQLHRVYLDYVYKF